MLTMKDLECRVYEGIQVVSFMYTHKDDKGIPQWQARFYRDKDEPRQWAMQVVLDRTRDADSQVYNFGYVMPKLGLPLELVAATGLKYFQLYLKQEIERKITMDFEIGEITDGVVG